jgi:hypothetical protein
MHGVIPLLPLGHIDARLSHARLELLLQLAGHGHLQEKREEGKPAQAFNSETQIQQALKEANDQLPGSK